MASAPPCPRARCRFGERFGFGCRWPTKCAFLRVGIPIRGPEDAMDDAAKLAFTVGAIVFGLMVLVPIASFLLKAAVVAGLAGLAVFVLVRIFRR